MRQPARRHGLLIAGRHRASAGRPGEVGASSIELAMIAPALIFLIFFVVQVGLFFYGAAAATQAAREGVSQLRLAPDAATYAVIRDTVVANTQHFATQVGRESLVRPVATPAYDEVNGTVTMQVEGRVINLVPFLDLRVTETAYGTVERFQ